MPDRQKPFADVRPTSAVGECRDAARDRVRSGSYGARLRRRNASASSNVGQAGLGVRIGFPIARCSWRQGQTGMQFSLSLTVLGSVRAERPRGSRSCWVSTPSGGDDRRIDPPAFQREASEPLALLEHDCGRLTKRRARRADRHRVRCGGSAAVAAGCGGAGEVERPQAPSRVVSRSASTTLGWCRARRDLDRKGPISTGITSRSLAARMSSAGIVGRSPCNIDDAPISPRRLLQRLVDPVRA